VRCAGWGQRWHRDSGNSKKQRMIVSSISMALQMLYDLGMAIMSAINVDSLSRGGLQLGGMQRCHFHVPS
jgi:hypothetical protein